MNKIPVYIFCFGLILILSAVLLKDYFIPDRLISVPPAISGVTERVETNRWNKHAVDSAISLLKSGNVVLRIGSSAISQMLAQMNQKDKTWSHCGIVMVEYGYPFVYHAIGGEDNPDERLRRDSARWFFSPLNNDGIAVVSYDFKDSTLQALKSIVEQYYQARPKFDIKFDLATDDALYCSEFVYKSLIKATCDTSFISLSHSMGHTYAGTDDLFMNGHAHFVCRIKFK